MVESANLRALFFYGPLETNWIGHQMAEIFRDGVYKPYMPLGKEGKLALDIGANIGLASIYFSNFFDQVISLEPSEEHFDALKRNMESNLITNVKPIKKAIYIKNGQFPFGGLPTNRTMRSLHMGVWNGGQPSETVDCVTLDTLFDQEKIEHVDFMKLDIEGSETELISSEGFSAIASKIDTIMGEYYNWSGRNPHQIVDAFHLNGFSYKTIETLQSSSIFLATKI